MTRENLLTDRDLLHRAVMNWLREAPKQQEVWVAVRNLFGVGSTTARYLCEFKTDD